jgi:hypothetical protein
MRSAVAARKLTVSKLSQALKLDINTVLLSTKSAVERLFAQLVSINQETGLISLIHPTARELFFSATSGEFAVSKPLAHGQLQWHVYIYFLATRCARRTTGGCSPRRGLLHRLF